MLDGYACLGRSDYACVERLFGEGRATDARELGILVRAQRAAGDDTAACASMQALVDRFPQSPEAARTRVLRAQRCTPH
jgi:Tfp pilus assembly protein PilF